MALPLPEVHSLADCASFGRTVSPFLWQLLGLSTRISEAGKDLGAWKEIYLTTNPFITALAVTLFLCPVFLIASEINRNWSQVDRFWPILPAVYNVHFAVWAHLTDLPTDKLNTVAIVTVLWSVRLTFNYWRRGGYQIGSEDYRWQIVRSKINNDFLFFLFNVVFISTAQLLLLCFVTASTYSFVVLSQLPASSEQQYGIPDLVFSRLIFFFIIIEAVADQQQWNFHCAKQEYQKTARVPVKYKTQYTPEDLERGFVVSGLWSWSRHPNFAAEQAIWLTFYLWNCYCTQTYVNWTGIGTLGYLLIFQGSTPLTESITASKYPEYADYQARVGRFIPRLSVEAKGKRAGSAPSADATVKTMRPVKAANDGTLVAEDGVNDEVKKSK